jgi:hypothetical protein
MRSIHRDLARKSEEAVPHRRVRLTWEANTLDCLGQLGIFEIISLLSFII